MLIKKCLSLLFIGLWATSLIASREDPDALKRESYIHEPYWRYGPQELEQYALRFLGGLRPHVVDGACVDMETMRVQTPNGPVSVRKVDQFDRVAPLLVLTGLLKNSPTHGVPRFFLVPKAGDVTLTFHMPFVREGQNELHMDGAFNPVHITSDSFDIYQEYVQGTGLVGDRSFALFGHSDFNACQIIQSADGRKYLIDTKATKNFFCPALSPFATRTAYWHFHTGRALPTGRAFLSWQERARQEMLAQKTVHYPAEQTSVTLSLGPYNPTRLEGVSLPVDPIFWDEDERTPYFEDARENLVRFLALGKGGLFKAFMEKYPQVSLEGLEIPSVIQSTFMGLVTPVQCLLAGHQNLEETRALLSYFEAQPHLFENHLRNTEARLSPLHMAVQTLDPGLVAYMLARTQHKDLVLGTQNPLDLAVSLLKAHVHTPRWTQILETVTLLASHMQCVAPSTLTTLLSLTNEGTLSLEDGGFLLSRLHTQNPRDLVRVLERAAAFKNIAVFNLALILTQDQDVLNEVLRCLLRDTPKNHAHALETLFKRTHADARTVVAVFDTQDRALLETMLEGRFDLNSAFLQALSRVEDPSHDDIRLLHGNPAHDAYWADLTKDLLGRGPSPEALDQATARALDNHKVQILKDLLDAQDSLGPRTQDTLQALAKSGLRSDLILTRALEAKNGSLVRCLVKAGLPVKITHVRLALGKGQPQGLMDTLLEASSLPKVRTLIEAIGSRDTPVVQNLVGRMEVLSYQVFQEAFRGADSGVLGALSTHPDAKEGGAIRFALEELMQGENPFETLERLLDHGMGVGDILVLTARAFPRFDTPPNERVGKLYALLEKTLAAKPAPSATLIDEAFAAALTNRKTGFLGMVHPFLPDETPRTWRVVQNQCASKYMAPAYKHDASCVGSARLMAMFERASQSPGQAAASSDRY